MAAAFLFFGILVLDQLIKGLVQVSFVPGESVVVIEHIFNITTFHTFNTYNTFPYIETNKSNH